LSEGVVYHYGISGRGGSEVREVGILKTVSGGFSLDLEFWAVNEIRACIGGRASKLACVPVSCVSLPPASACTAMRLSRFANAAPLPLFVLPCFAPVRSLSARWLCCVLLRFASVSVCSALCAGCWLAGGCVHLGEPSASAFAIFTQGHLRPVCLGLWSRVVGFSYRASRGVGWTELNKQSRLLLTAGSRSRTITTYMYTNSSLEQKIGRFT